ncbi:Hypothetical predicted protein [Paramuricea clavata]|uniref:ZSWIM1/3 RNaseH-like domain-containing protein n=1 Tax=Paramuricea clavata TaxID=317549 RepID=A0A7D9ICY0_PARCT|nr:Hypothetical predicted protein [Paramuricea clavata]
MLVVGGNGESEIVGLMLAADEHQDTIRQMMIYFKEQNPKWREINCIMADKDMMEHHAEKVKSVQQDYRADVNKGTQSGSGKIVEDNYDFLTGIWGGSPATTSLPFGVDGMDEKDKKLIFHSMSRFLVDNPNPRVFNERAALDEVDVDHMPFNIPVDHEETLAVLQSFVGSSLLLSTNKGRFWRHEDWRYVVLTWHPIITLIPFSVQTKVQLCQYFSANRHIVLTSGDEATHLIRGSNKPVPATTFLLALIDAGVQFVRLVNFGMKMKLNTFPDLPRDLLDCAAEDNGFPPNEWDISLSRRTDYLYLIKPHAPYPLHVTPNPYPILTPLNPNLMC